ncbi:hypothetical protein [Aquibacillus sediminis]|uniref:hypothetical protein n=1 Tax=Aquibacillus sediminis TaxID=2574734 RepID=UPI00110822D7|nr:hypothetical protein [Aquibacillus sediminis]
MLKTPGIFIQLWLYDKMIYQKSKFKTKYDFVPLWAPKCLKEITKLKKMGCYKEKEQNGNEIKVKTDKLVVDEILDLWRTVGLIEKVGRRDRFFHKIVCDYLPAHEDKKESLFVEWGFGSSNYPKEVREAIDEYRKNFKLLHKPIKHTHARIEENRKKDMDKFFVQQRNKFRRNIIEIQNKTQMNFVEDFKVLEEIDLKELKEMHDQAERKYDNWLSMQNEIVRMQNETNIVLVEDINRLDQISYSDLVGLYEVCESTYYWWEEEKRKEAKEEQRIKREEEKRLEQEKKKKAIEKEKMEKTKEKLISRIKQMRSEKDLTYSVGVNDLYKSDLSTVRRIYQETIGDYEYHKQLSLF